MMITRTVSASMLVLLAGTSACVTTGTYDAKVAELDKLKRDSADRDKQQTDTIQKLQAEAKDLQAKIDSLSSDLKDASASFDDVTKDRDQLKKQLDDTTALAGELKKRLEKLGQNVDKLTSERGQLAQTLEDAKHRLDELRKQKEAVEARAATFRDLAHKLHAMIDSGKLKVVVRKGRMLIALPNDVLFKSGSTNIEKGGQQALADVAHALATIDNRRFEVAGHTDDVPIHTARFPSNWELSTARAVEVTKFLVQNGVHPEVLGAAGYGEFDPVVSNDSDEHRGQNRRIEIALLPNIAELPQIEDLKI